MLHLRPLSVLRRYLKNEASGGVILIVAATLALLAANSALQETYFEGLHAYIGPLSLQHWINDGLMALFFLLVGLELKREILDGHLATRSRRRLPMLAALGGMVVPALIYASVNWGNADTIRGWAIPAATDIAFALGVLQLLGPRIPTSLKVFLTALAIIDDLGAISIIAVFYTTDLSLVDLGVAALIVGGLVVLNRYQVLRLWPYLLLGTLLWLFVYRSGIHATIAGVITALVVPLRPSPGHPDDVAKSPLHHLEHRLHPWVAFLILPIFGFANAGVSFAGLSSDLLVDPLTLGVVLGLVVGKFVGVFGSSVVAIKLGLASMPRGATWSQVIGVAMLCGIGFTMSLFIGLLAFENDVVLQDATKIGILAGSIISGMLMGSAVLLFSPRRIQPSGLLRP